MDNSSLSPSHVDNVIASEIPLLKPTVEAEVEAGTIPELSPSSSNSIMSPRTVTEAAPKTVMEAKLEEGGAKEKPAKSKSETWDPNPFFRDASWFSTHCKLPDEGDIPLKIVDVSEKMLKDCFGEKSRNGYKLSLCVGIPVADLLALSQVADGYEKPVNGMISHSFAKGAYAERILKRKVNWASYASTKLKGQVLQIHREQKPKPDGPPWVRKVQVYSPPVGDHLENKVSSAAGKGKAPADFIGEEWSPEEEKTVEVDPSATMPQPSVFASRHDALSNPTKESSSSELLKLICDQVLKMKASLSKVAADRQKVQATIAKLGEEELGNTRTVNALTKEIDRLELEVVELIRKLALEEDLVGEATTDIELESNKETEGDDPDEIGGQLLTMMTEKLATHEAAVCNWQSLISRTKSTLSSTKDQLQRAKIKHEKSPWIVKKLTAVSTALEGERVKLESDLNDLTCENKIVRLTLSKPCTPLSPIYVLTSTDAFLANVTVTSCPLCCNGYHCNNWVPASCGHTYHPVCLFTYLTEDPGKAKCIVCGEGFSYDWLRCWGVDTSWRDPKELRQFEGLVNDNENLYGRNSSYLSRRRQWVQNMDILQTKDDQDEITAVAGLQSRVASSVVTEEGDDVMLLDAGLEPKVKGEAVKKQRVQPVGSAQRTLNSTPSSIGPASCIAQESFALPLTPSATLPFSPERSVVFKPYNSVRTPRRSMEPTIAKRKSHRVEANWKKQIEFSD